MKRKNNKKIETTLDDLAIMVQKGFAETATKAELGEVKTELGEVNKWLDRIEFNMRIPTNVE